MPRILYKCQCGSESYSVWATSKGIPDKKKCESCGEESLRQLSAPSSKSVFVVDNGVQARAVEVNMETVESRKEDSRKDYNRGD